MVLFETAIMFLVNTSILWSYDHSMV